MIYEKLVALLAEDAVVVATVVAVKGSAPREVGAKMLIASGGCFDTIGGGAGEAKVVRQARIVLQTGRKQLTEIDLTGTATRETATRETATRETEGICGGWMQVWLERWQGEAAVSLASQITARLRLGQSVTLVTPYETGFPYLSADRPANAFIETLQPDPMLLIVGAGHVGEQLANLAHLSGFQIALQDDRPDWANLERYPQAALIAPQLDQALAQLATHPQLYAALVTRSYRYDLVALSALLNREPPCLYIGMIGSLHRVRQVYQQVERAGSAAKLETVYAPIGLDIGALTPAEIAVSICAELILVRRGGTGKSLRQETLGFGGFTP